MSGIIEKLLLRNLQEVFGDGDPTRRRAAIEELHTEDCTVLLPIGRFVGRAALDQVAGELRASHPRFVYLPHRPPQAVQDGGRLAWRSGPAKVLSEYFGSVIVSDIHPYGYGAVMDFLAMRHETSSCDWVTTNPPFRLGEEFINLSLKLARRGVAMLTRTVFIESVGRYQRLFSRTPPACVAQFTERVPMIKGRLDRSASTATGYAWLVWEKDRSDGTALVWIPPCRKVLERDDD